MADLLSLPVELQTEIIEYLTSQADLKAACLTCKTLSPIATKRLYRNLVIPFAALDWREGRGVFNPANIKHVRRIEVVGLEDHNLIGQSVVLFRRLRDLLQAVPKDQLEYLVYVSLHKVPRCSD
jgi:hypothetical protein